MWMSCNFEWTLPLHGMTWSGNDWALQVVTVNTHSQHVQVKTITHNQPPKLQHHSAQCANLDLFGLWLIGLCQENLCVWSPRGSSRPSPSWSLKGWKPGLTIKITMCENFRSGISTTKIRLSVWKRTWSQTSTRWRFRTKRCSKSVGF